MGRGGSQATIAAGAAAGLAVAQQVAARACRDALFLTEYDAVHLPLVMLAVAALSLMGAVWSGRWMARSEPRSVVVAMGACSALLFAAEALFLERAPHVVAVVNYLHVSVVGAIVVSGLWSIINERFDPYAAKRRVARIASGAAFGGLMGGLLAHVLAEWTDLQTTLWVLSGLGLATTGSAWWVGPSIQKRADTLESLSGSQALRRNPYLRQIAYVVVLLGAAGVLVDYALKAEADRHFTDSSGLLSFFALFYTATSLGTFVVQTGLGKLVLQRMGLGAAMASLPIALVITAGFGAVWTRLASVSFAQGVQSVLSNSLFRSGYELLYTPVAPEEKRPSKTIIDVALDKVGDGLGSMMLMALTAVTAVSTVSWALGFATAIAVVGVILVVQLQNGYVEQLARSLQSGAVKLGDAALAEATTRRTLASTQGLNRTEILAGIEKLRQQHGAESPPRGEQAQLEALLSNDPVRLIATLGDETVSPRVAPLIIELLADERYAKVAQAALKNLAPRITGLLIDVLFDPTTGEIVARRIPRVLYSCGNARATRGLLDGLRHPSFEVRYRCGQALAKRQEDETGLEFPRALIFELVTGELEQPDHPAPEIEDRDDVVAEIHALFRARSDRGLEHVFTILSLVLDRQAIVSSLHALDADDPNLRGTALEYLDQVLPENIKKRLRGRLGL